MRRKKRVTTKSSNNEDKKVQTTLKRLGVQPIPGIEEVNMFMDDGETVLNFKNPTVQAAVAANTFVIAGPNETKDVKSVMPKMFGNMSQNQLFSQLAQNLQQTDSNKPITENGDADGTAVENDDEAEAGDDDIPDLVEDFEEVSKQ